MKKNFDIVNFFTTLIFFVLLTGRRILLFFLTEGEYDQFAELCVTACTLPLLACLGFSVICLYSVISKNKKEKYFLVAITQIIFSILTMIGYFGAEGVSLIWFIAGLVIFILGAIGIALHFSNKNSSF